MSRAEKRREVRKLRNEIMQNELHADKVDMTRKERRELSYEMAKEMVDNEN